MITIATETRMKTRERVQETKGVSQAPVVTSFSRGRILITSLVRMLTTMLLPSASITSILSILLEETHKGEGIFLAD